MRVAIVGSRSFVDYREFCRYLSHVDWFLDVSEIVSGGAYGTDSMAKLYALQNNIPITEFLPEWDKYGKKAGPIRNEKIVNYCERLIAFWNGKSAGTKNSINLARQQNKLGLIIYI